MVFPHVRVADVLESSSSDRGGFNRISQKHVDYLLVSLPNFQPIVAIELTALIVHSNPIVPIAPNAPTVGAIPSNCNRASVRGER